MSIYGATDAPVSDFWWCLLWVSKPEWEALATLGRGIHDIRIGGFPTWIRTFIEFSELSEFRGSEAWIGLNLKILPLTCLAGAVVASWFLTQEVADLSPFK